MRHNQKLTEEQAKEIALSEAPARFFTEKYGISKQLVSKIRNRDNWTKLELGELMPKTRAVTGKGFIVDKEVYKKWKEENQ